jgi:hypothetical protein
MEFIILFLLVIGLGIIFRIVSTKFGTNIGRNVGNKYLKDEYGIDQDDKEHK